MKWRRFGAPVVGDVTFANWARRTPGQPLVDASPVVAVQARQRAKCAASGEQLETHHALSVVLRIRARGSRVALAAGANYDSVARENDIDGAALDGRAIEAVLDQTVIIVVAILRMPAVSPPSAHTHEGIPRHALRGAEVASQRTASHAQQSRHLPETTPERDLQPCATAQESAAPDDGADDGHTAFHRVLEADTHTLGATAVAWALSRSARWRG